MKKVRLKTRGLTALCSGIFHIVRCFPIFPKGFFSYVMMNLQYFKATAFPDYGGQSFLFLLLIIETI